MDVATSVQGVPIRLPEERWKHISEEHGELTGARRAVLETISAPERVVEGRRGERLALREVEPGKHLVVIYRAFENDGFIITAYLTRRLRTINRRKQLWP